MAYKTPPIINFGLNLKSFPPPVILRITAKQVSPERHLKKVSTIGELEVILLIGEPMLKSRVAATTSSIGWSLFPAV